MASFAIRAATLDDLEALTDIYNHYIVHTPITFDLQAFTPAERRPWLDGHGDSGRYRLLVATNEQGRCVGFASSSRWRQKAAYDSTVETSVYCHPDVRGRGCGTALYTALFAALEHEDVHAAVAGVTLPNPSSLALHEKFGFRPVGVFHAVGQKFGQFWDVAWFERALRTIPRYGGRAPAFAHEPSGATAGEPGISRMNLLRYGGRAPAFARRASPRYGAAGR